MEENSGGTAGGGVREERGDRGAAGDAEFEGQAHGAGPVKIKAGKEKSKGKAAVITFHIPGPLRSFSGGRSDIEVEARADTLAEALQALWAACPGMRDRVVTEQGQIREHINIFVGKENIRYTGGLATVVVPGAEVSIVPAISGGTNA